jgi:tripartite-type tricarboxylate transporter receptor subunit TctC
MHGLARLVMPATELRLPWKCRIIFRRGGEVFDEDNLGCDVLDTADADGRSGHAQSPAGSYPNRLVKILVPFQPGGAVDVAGRLVAQKLSESLGQIFVVDNRGGGGGNIGTALVQEAPADGYTLLITSSAFVINPGLQKVNYDAIRGFAPISIVCTCPSILAGS